MMPWHPASLLEVATVGQASGCAALIEAADWAATPLGPRTGWSPALVGALGLVLRSPMPMKLLWGQDGIALYNDAYASILGTRHPRTLGLSILEVWPEHKAFHEEVLRICLAGGTLSLRDSEEIVDGPEPRYFDFDYWSAPDAAGRPAGVLCALGETTAAVRATRGLRAAEERARAEAARWRDAEERLRQVLAGARAGAWEMALRPGESVFRAQGVRWDDGYRRIYGFAPDEEPNAGKWRARIHPEDLPLIDGNVQAALEGGPSEWVQEFRLLHPERGPCWIHDRVRLRRDASGRPVSLSGLNFDITDRRQAEAERDRALALLETFVQAVPGVAFAKDLEGRHLLGNRNFYDLIGKPPEACVGRPDSEFLDDTEEARLIEAADRRIMTVGEVSQCEELVTHSDGSTAWWLSTKAPMRDLGGEVVGLVGAAVEITARKAAEAALIESEARFRNMADHAPVMMWVTDAQGVCTYLNRMWQEFTGQDETAARGAGWQEATHPDDQEEAARVFRDTNARRVPFRIRYRVRRADGAWRWVIDAGAPRWKPDGEFLGFVGSLVDISDHVESQEAVDLARRAAEHLARHDSLTGLASRKHFREMLGRHLVSGPVDGRVALLYIDLDEFKSVNDAFGHPAGDALLVEAGRRLRSCLKTQDVLARMGGDEFVILRPGAHDAAELARDLIARLSEPFDLDGASVVLGGSVGIALGTVRDTRPDDLLKQADIALYRAKAAGRGVFRFFEPEHERSAQERQKLRTDLRNAAPRNELRLHFQPVVDLGTLQPRGYEALLRWEHPERGLLGPGAFIELAESSGAIEPIGAWAIEEACRRAASWPEPLVVSVNLSPRQFRSGRVVQTVAGALEASGLPGPQLMVEITESVLLQDDEAVSRTLAGLRRLGARVAIDDFGIGYSSLGYLRRFAVDVIKIDRSFVADLAENSNSLAILRAVMSLGTDLGLSITAEGIETPDQLDRLRRLGCRFGQGYLFGRPSPGLPVRQDGGV